MFKKVGLVIGIAAMLSLVACGSSSSTTKTATPGASGASPVATKASGKLILATTTSTQDSGLLDVLVPAFEDESGYTVQTVSVGSGQAIAQASRGDADVVLVHSPDAEKMMVDAGDGIERTLVMHNDFILVGPKDDPAGIKQTSNINAAMQAIATKQAAFISRGDQSGTNAFELKLWKALNITPKGQSWYSESGQGMGATLQITNQRNAYTISDRGTFLSQQQNLDLQIVSERSPGLVNVYHVIVVNPDKHSNVNVTGARAFAAWITRPDIQEMIGKFGVDKFGQALFFPDAGKPEPTG